MSFSYKHGTDLFKLQEGSHHAQARTQGGVKGAFSWFIRQARRVFSGVALFQREEWTNPPVADVDAFLLAKEVTVAAQDHTVMDGVAAAGLGHPRNVTATTAGDDNDFVFPVTVIVTGTFRGAVQTETLTFADAGASPGTAAGTKPFDKVTRVQISGNTAGTATVSVGFGAGLGTAKTPKGAAGLIAPIREIVAGTAVTSGTLTAASLYTPASAPDGTRDYAIFYEADLSDITGR